MDPIVLVWFRRDLRLADNPALNAACERASSVVPVYIDDPDPAASASRAWLAASLESLDRALAEHGSRLVVRRGPAPEALAALARECRSTLVTCGRLWDPAHMAEESAVAAALATAGVELKVAESQYAITPGTLSSGNGSAYKVFTPFLRAWHTSTRAERPLQAPPAMPGPGTVVASDHAVRASRTVHEMWEPGETGATRRLERFVQECLEGYPEARDRPDLDGTSRLSPHLAFGELSPRQVIWAVCSAFESPQVTRPFVRQLAWREFAGHVMHTFPALDSEPLHPEFGAMPWNDDSALFDRWRAGRTGFPLVDAGMRQLAATGWMHDRVRLVVASVLTKDLLVTWRDGLACFADALVDVEPANNAFNWQWVAGSGADAAPYFRIFNPVLQAQRFDPDGAFVRRWIPEAGTPDYIPPMIDHAQARNRALAAHEAVARARATAG